MSFFIKLLKFFLILSFISFLYNLYKSASISFGPLDNVLKPIGSAADVLSGNGKCEAPYTYQIGALCYDPSSCPTNYHFNTSTGGCRGDDVSIKANTIGTLDCPSGYRHLTSNKLTLCYKDCPSGSVFNNDTVPTYCAPADNKSTPQFTQAKSDTLR